MDFIRRLYRWASEGVDMYVLVWATILDIGGGGGAVNVDPWFLYGPLDGGFHPVHCHLSA